MSTLMTSFMCHFPLAALCACLSLVAAVDPHHPASSSFQDWVGVHGRQYPTPEEQALRHGRFAANVARIAVHNARGGSYTLGLTPFADLSAEEFAASRVFGLRPPTAPRRAQDSEVSGYKGVRGMIASPLPSRTPSKTPRASNSGTASATASGSATRTASPSLTATVSASRSRTPSRTSTATRTAGAITAFDWATQDGGAYVTPVASQCSCSSCYAFSATAAIESAVAIALGGPAVPLSKQHAMDCTGRGCAGGWMDDVFALAATGLCSEQDYPYTAATCVCAPTCPPIAYVAGYASVPPNDAGLQAAVLQQPVSVAVQAPLDMQLYVSGVYDGTCGSVVNHAMVAVGYGVDEVTGLQYWKLRNSWGGGWGEGGYVRVLRDGSANDGTGQCGIHTYASFPTGVSTAPLTTTTG